MIVYNTNTVKLFLEDYSLFGTRLNETRKSRGFTAQQIADVAGVNLQSYRKYESNNRQPSYEMLVKIAEKLEVTTDYLLGRSEV